jgi:copper transport protein
VPRFRAALSACVLFALLLPGAAFGHAQLQSTAPARGAVVAHQPKIVSFTFGESVGGTPGAVRVYDSAGKRVDDGSAFHPGGDGPTLGVALKPGVPNGTYTATYRVVSADTHVVTGGFVFSIGAPSSGSGATVGQLLASQKTGRVTITAFQAAKAVQYAAIGIGAGLLAFLALVWLPFLTAHAGGTTEWVKASERFLARLRGGLLIASAAGLASAVVAIVLQGAQASGVTFWGALDWTVVKAVLQTRFGAVWIGAAVAWALAGVSAAGLLSGSVSRGVVLRPAALGADGATLGAPSSRRPLMLLALPLLATVALPALAGHASIQRPVWLFLPANLLHVSAMSLWLGGLVALVIALPAATRELAGGDRVRAVSAVLDRFSPFALAAVIVLLATGTIQALIEINAFSQLLHTAFGRAVLIKIVLLLALIGFGALNRQRTLPRLRKASGRQSGTGATGLLLRRTLRTEVALIATVLVITGALSGYAPANQVGSGPAHVDSTLGPAQLSMDITPARVGPNEIHIYLLDPKSGAQYAKVRQLTVTADLASKRIGPLPLAASLTGPGHYTIQSAVLGAPGTWTISLTGRVSEFDEYQRTVKVHIR